MATRNTGNMAGIFSDQAELEASSVPNNQRVELLSGTRYQTGPNDLGSGVALFDGNFANPIAAVPDPQTAINTGNISTNAGDISTNAGDISNNAGDITNNAGNITTNTGNISTNTGNISTNTGDIEILKADNPNNQTGTAYTVALGDENKTVWMNNAAANTLTIPLNATEAFDINTVIMVMMEGVGITSIQAVAGVTINGLDNGFVDIAAIHSGATLVKRGVDAWIVTGNISVVA